MAEMTLPAVSAGVEVSKDQKGQFVMMMNAQKFKRLDTRSKTSSGLFEPCDPLRRASLHICSICSNLTPYDISRSRNYLVTDTSPGLNLRFDQRLKSYCRGRWWRGRLPLQMNVHWRTFHLVVPCFHSPVAAPTHRDCVVPNGTMRKTPDC
jgi:hypothetical protein